MRFLHQDILLLLMYNNSEASKPRQERYKFAFSAQLCLLLLGIYRLKFRISLQPALEIYLAHTNPTRKVIAVPHDHHVHRRDKKQAIALFIPKRKLLKLFEARQLPAAVVFSVTGVERALRAL